MKRTLAENIVDDVLTNLSGRRGLDAALEDIDEEVAADMFDDLAGLVRGRIATLEAKLAIYEDDHGRHCCDHELGYCRVATGLAELEKGE